MDAGRKKIVIYGAGKKGIGIYKFLDSINLNNIVECFCDKNADAIISVGDKKVVKYEEIKNGDFVYFVSPSEVCVQREICNTLTLEKADFFVDIANYLVNNGYISDAVEFNRNFCAYYHIEKMDDYFISAESEKNLAVFWAEKSVFYEMFKYLDLTNVVELACGRGRHVQKYLHRAKQVTLVDILGDNIDYCKSRFCEHSNIKYYKNSGYNLEELKNGSYTSLFTYDAMVHFEMFDINEYLKDIYRILKPGGYSLFHHSNNDIPDASFANNVNGRSFMSKNLFAYLSIRAGFEIVKQRVIDWSVPELDCITLIKKP